MAKHFSAAPATRVEFFGQMAAPDDFGRVRVIFLETAPDGSPDFSIDVVRRAVDRAARGPDPGLPYYASSVVRDGVRGTVTLVAPERHRAHWLAVAAALRNRRVRVEATVRPYVFPGKKSGVSLDISIIELA